MRNIRLVIAYDGGRYRGWQRLQDSDQTIQGKLEQVISTMTGKETEITGSGRTDAGAHARAQVANFHTESEMHCDEIHHYLNHYLPRDIAVQSVAEAPARFHARYQAKSKRYHYYIWNHWIPPVFQRNYCCHLADPLDVAKMDQAAQKLLGSHDFINFSSLKKSGKSTVRTIQEIAVTRDGRMLTFSLSGDGFLYNMVRIIVGSLVEVGAGTREPDYIDAILTGKTRSIAGMTLPSQGLFLEEVLY